jgi:hypothetical protein
VAATGRQVSVHPLHHAAREIPSRRAILAFAKPAQQQDSRSAPILQSDQSLSAAFTTEGAQFPHRRHLVWLLVVPLQRPKKSSRKRIQATASTVAIVLVGRLLLVIAAPIIG